MATEHPSGRKTRVEQHTHKIPVTLDGRTRMVDTTIDVLVPVPPRDWDHLVLRGVTIATTAVVGASVIWSTASISGLLATTVALTIAVVAAIVFDTVWINCMAIEWLCRYDQARARLPRIAGHIALAFAMTAIAVQGWMTGHVVAGIVGASISGLAKGLWSVLIAHTARPLPSPMQQWVDQELAEETARLALATIQRQRARTVETTAAIRATYAPPADNEDNVPDTVVRAVRAAADTMPGASPEDISDQLDHAGIDVSEDVVRDVLADNGQRDNGTTGRVVRFGEPDPTSIAGTIRACVGSHVRDLDVVLARVHQVHGAHVTRGHVRRELDRQLDRLKRTA